MPGVQEVSIGHALIADALELGLAETHGTIELGKVADFCLWDVDHPAELAYAVAASPLRARFHGGRDHLA